MNTHEDIAMADTYDPTAQARQVDPAGRPGSPPDATYSRRDVFLDDPRRKSPVLALVLSMMPGLGQVYVGYYQQGFTNALVVASLIGMLSSGVLNNIEPLFGIFLGFFWMFNVVDAWRRAVFYNNALAGIGPANLPDDFGMPKGRGSLAGGAALIIVGGVTLSHTLFGVSLQWLENWWPVAIIAVGVWLIYPTFAARRKQDEPPTL